MQNYLLRRRWPLGLVLVLVVASFAAVTDNPYYLRLAIQYGCIYAVVIAGLNVLIGAAGQVSLGHVGLFVIGAYVGASAAKSMPWMLAALLAIAAALVGGALIAAPALRLRGAYLALSTLAFALIVLQLIDVIPRLLGTPGDIRDVPRPVLGPIVLSSWPGYFLFCVLLAAPVVAIARNVFWSQTGRQLRALSDNEPAAQSLGIAVFPAKLGAFLFSAACAGLAGVMFASFNGFVSESDFKPSESLRFVIALLIGGMAAPVAGPVLGAALMMVLVYVGQAWFQENEVLLTACVLLAILAFAPRGMGGALRRAGGWLGLGWMLPGETLVDGALVRRGGRAGDISLLRPSGAADAAAIVAVGTNVAGRGELRAVDHPAGPVVIETAPLLDVVDVAKSYGGVRAVDHVSFVVRRGEIHVLMGPNGSGKSTCLDLISGLTPTESGRIRLNGTDLTDLPAHQRARAGVARTFQEIRLFPSLTVLENCMVGNTSRLHTWTQLLRLPAARDEEEAHADEALELLEAWGLGEFAARPASALSYGQRKMLELARAASRRPNLLLVDEPSAGLNPTWVAAMVQALSSLRSAGYTLLVVEHHQDVIADLADVVTVLDQGRVIAEGAPAEVQRDPAVMTVYLGAGRRVAQ